MGWKGVDLPEGPEAGAVVVGVVGVVVVAEVYQRGGHRAIIYKMVDVVWCGGGGSLQLVSDIFVC